MACAVSTSPPVGATIGVGLEPSEVLARGWELSPGVAVRPERFGALLYDFGTRRLSFVKDRRLVEVVRLLPSCESGRAACLAAGLTEPVLPTYGRALSRLVATGLLRERA